MLSIDRFLSSKRDFRFFSSILLICWPLKPLINLFFTSLYERNILSKKTLLLTICSVKWEKTWKFHFYKLLFDAPSRFCQGMRQMKQDAEKSSTFRFGLFVKSLKSRKSCKFNVKKKQDRKIIRENAMVFVLYDFTSKIAWFLSVVKKSWKLCFSVIY